LAHEIVDKYKNKGSTIMYAIIETGGKQYKVTEGETIHVERLGLETGSAVEFPEVLFVFDGNDHKLGQPSVNGFVVKGEVIGESTGPKIQSVKYKPRKRQNKKFGHRQHYTQVKINEIAKA
jgi:large subunit ribosomal protein L21